MTRPVIILTGGGSGGHVTPVISVAHELAKMGKYDLVYVGERGSKFKQVVLNAGVFSKIYYIPAGKYRRYHGHRFYQVKLREHLKNARDLFRFGLGVLASAYIVLRHHPRELFSKGGYVALPIGLIAGAMHVPIVTHDSDYIPGMSNRLLKRYAVKQLKGFGKGEDVVGVPISSDFQSITKSGARSNLKINKLDKVLLITGGGNAAKLVNDAAIPAVIHLIKKYENLVVMHHSGSNHFKSVLDSYAEGLNQSQIERVRVEPYINNMHEWMFACDLIVARAGMTTFSEIATVGRPAIIIPNPRLTDGHQTKNAEEFQRSGAAIVVLEAELINNSSKLEDEIESILINPNRASSLASEIHKHAKSNVAAKIAEIVDNIAERYAKA